MSVAVASGIEQTEWTSKSDRCRRFTARRLPAGIHCHHDWENRDRNKQEGSTFSGHSDERSLSYSLKMKSDVRITIARRNFLARSINGNK